ncbi:hypothetical protein ACFLV7_09490 [Chloroflexota bacterium]
MNKSDCVYAIALVKKQALDARVEESSPKPS